MLIELNTLQLRLNSAEPLFGTRLCHWLKAFPVAIVDKSRVAQLKARRRSSVGVRGSPETNSLIRFMAQQRIKSASSCQTPEVRCFPMTPKIRLPLLFGSRAEIAP